MCIDVDYVPWICIDANPKPCLPPLSSKRLILSASSVCLLCLPPLSSKRLILGAAPKLLLHQSVSYFVLHQSGCANPNLKTRNPQPATRNPQPKKHLKSGTAGFQDLCMCISAGLGISMSDAPECAGKEGSGSLPHASSMLMTPTYIVLSKGSYMSYMMSCAFYRISKCVFLRLVLVRSW
jgi:hypothetical protein